MTTLERLDLQFLKSIIDPMLGRFQFAYRGNRYVDDAVSLGLFHVLKHLEGQNTYPLKTVRENTEGRGSTIHVPVDPRFSVEQTAGCENMWRLIVITYFVNWHTSMLCPATNAILSFYICLCILS